MTAAGPRPGADSLLVAGLGGLLATGVSGAALALVYAPTPDHAYDSIRVIEQLRGGRLLRAFHHWVSWLTLGCWIVHAARLFVRGDFGREPARWRRVLAVVALCGVGVGTGLVLPWDTSGAATSTVAASLLRSVPGIGAALAAGVQGGREGGSSALARAFVVHAVLLGPLLVMLGMSLWRVRRGMGFGALAALLGLALLAGLCLPRGLDAPAGSGDSGQPHPCLAPMAALLESFHGPPWLLVAAVALVLVAAWLLPCWPAFSSLRTRGLRAGLVLVPSLFWLVAVPWPEVRPRPAPPPFAVPAVRHSTPTPDSPPFLAPEGLPPDQSAFEVTKDRLPERVARELVPEHVCSRCHGISARPLRGSYAGDLEGAMSRLEDLVEDEHPGLDVPLRRVIEGLSPAARSRLLEFLMNV